MKIAVFHELPPGGALRAAVELTNQLRSKHEIVEFETSFLPTKGKGLQPRISHDFFDLLRLRGVHKKLAREINVQNFDLVIVHPSKWTQAPFLLSFLSSPSMYYCQEPLRLVYDPFISNMENLTTLQRSYEVVNRLWRKWIDRANTLAANHIVTNSHFTKKWIEKAYGRSAYVCYLGVDLEKFIRKDVEKKYDILFLGAPEMIEGYDLLVEAQKYQKKAWNIHVVKRNSNGQGITDSQLILTINQSKIVVCLSRNEPFGLTVLEAAACGVPVVAVREGGLKESVTSLQNGILIDRDPQALALAIDTLLSSSQLRKKLANEGRQRVRAEWSWEKSGQRLERIVRNFIRNKTSRTRVFSEDSLSLIGTAYVILMFMSLAVIRLGFRPLRQLFPAPMIVHGVVGYAQFTGYPFSFETYLFGLLFLTPVLIAIVLRMILRKKRI